MRISDWSSDVCSSDLGGLSSDIIDRTGGHILAKQSPLRPFENLDTLQIECDPLRHTRKRQRHLVQIDAYGWRYADRFFKKANATNLENRRALRAWSESEAKRHFLEILRSRHTKFKKPITLHSGDRQRHITLPFAAFLCCYNDFVDR